MRLRLAGDPQAEELILFFLGWAMDERPFLDLIPPGTAVAFLYDYRDLELPAWPPFPKVKVLAWSLGVRVALYHRERLPYEMSLVAGTGAFVDPRWGIPPRVFNLTLKALREKGESVLSRFYQKMFEDPAHWERFERGTPQRPLKEVQEELEIQALKVPVFPSSAKGLKVWITQKDAVFPSQAQKAYWERAGVPVNMLPEGHFPFYSYPSLKVWF